MYNDNYSFLGYEVVWITTQVRTFRRSFLTPSSGQYAFHQAEAGANMLVGHSGTHISTNSTAQNPTRNSQVSPLIARSRNIHYSEHNSPPPVGLYHLNHIRDIQNYFMTNFNITSPSKGGPSCGLLTSGYPAKTLHISSLPAYNIPPPISFPLTLI